MAHGYWLCSEVRWLLHRWYLHLRMMMLSPAHLWHGGEMLGHQEIRVRAWACTGCPPSQQRGVCLGHILGVGRASLLLPHGSVASGREALQRSSLAVAVPPAENCWKLQRFQ